MPKPWEYTPRRHLLMQAIMCVVLCGTLGLAYAVSRSLAAPSGLEVKVGPVALRLPDGFMLDNNPEADLQAHDAERRVLLVLLAPDVAGDDASLEQLPPIDFRGINQTGRLSSSKRALPGSDGVAARVAYTATARIPKSNQRIVINLLAVEAGDEDSNADQELLQLMQKIANSVTATGEKSTPRQRDHSKDTVVLQSFPRRGAKL